ncbi:hypothetical protein [Ornithinimicrobium murale]|uniref:hypothetical protein n=1 Tax=Ornithinimicrobium murale TaxID=1050153 RepID=UPI000E0D31C6|nr:hypothetical protein [Ornithinimicrobium murale]
MSDNEFRDALERAADVVPDQDLAQTTWYAGRSRKRRTSRAWWGAGVAAAAATVVGVIAWNGGGLSLPDAGPAGTAGDDAARTSDAAPTGTEEPTRSGQPTILTFTREKGEFELSGGVLELWTPDDGLTTTWHLTDELMAMGGPEQAKKLDPNITLTLEQGTWSVRGCGLAMQALGTVEEGRVQITGHWDVDVDPDPGAACESHPSAWLDSERWESLLSGSPLVAQDGTTLILSGTVGEQPLLEPVSVGFARSDVTDPKAGAARAATWEDLAQGWVEVPVEDLMAQIPGHDFVDTELDPETAVQITSAGVGDLAVSGCQEIGFRNSWLLDVEGSSLFLDQQEVRALAGCSGPGEHQGPLVTGMLSQGAQISVHGDYLVIDGWADPAVLDPQPIVDTRPELLSPAMQLPDLKQLSPADTLLPEVIELPADGIPTLVEDPTDRFVAAVVSEDSGDLMVLGSDQRWRIAATGAGGVSRDGLFALLPSLLETSIAPQGDQIAYRTTGRLDASIVIVTSTGEVVEHPTDGGYPNNFPNDFRWLDDDRLAVDLREDDAMIIDTSTGQVTHDASWNQLRQVTPWRIIVQAGEDEESGEVEQSGPVVLQQLDAGGEVTEETPLGFTSQPGYQSALAEDRVATVITTQDPTVIEPEGWQGEVPESVSLVLAKDGTLDSLSVLQAEAHTVTPVRWVDRGTLVVRVAGDGLTHYVLWDTQNGGITHLTQTDPTHVRAGPVFAQSHR